MTIYATKLIEDDDIVNFEIIKNDKNMYDIFVNTETERLLFRGDLPCVEIANSIVGSLNIAPIKEVA